MSDVCAASLDTYVCGDPVGNSKAGGTKLSLVSESVVFGDEADDDDSSSSSSTSARGTRSLARRLATFFCRFCSRRTASSFNCSMYTWSVDRRLSLRRGPLVFHLAFQAKHRCCCDGGGGDDDDDCGSIEDAAVIEEGRAIRLLSTGNSCLEVVNMVRI